MKTPRWVISAFGALLVVGAVGTTLMRVEEEIADQRKVSSIEDEIRKNRDVSLDNQRLLQGLGETVVLGYVETWGANWKASTNRLRGDTREGFSSLHDENVAIARRAAQ